ncbi:hypothetical protein QAD02_018108 [Eretmocerus hayati]|uniref:Uncharacterized protein n=1 Tax=Eretmocerus hayati TaxID=131215 RepID=A0ACC2PHQ4_9HYME|nr:hypothetical protein QAD02_018108 [Eretmocerus hayati]
MSPAIQKDPFTLTEADNEQVSKGEKLGDQHVDKFHQLITITTSTVPRSTLYCNKLERVKSISRGTQHVQIIHCSTDGCSKCEGGHWICFFYNGESFFIYDSLNFKSLYRNAEMFIRALCPFFDEVPIYFPDVQYQINDKDCGPHAMAMATSVIFGEDPCSVDYILSDLRPHILSMFCNNMMQLFPRRVRVGLPNPDGVSCYANASLQSIVHCEAMRQHIHHQSEWNPLFQAIRDYSSNSSVDIKLFRGFANGIFLITQQQDVSEFITFLFSKSDYFRFVFQHSLSATRTCLSCGLESKMSMNNNILIADLPENYKNGNLQAIIDHNLNKWRTTDICCGKELNLEEKLRFKCDEQGRCPGKIAEKLDLITEKDMIMLSLNISRVDRSGNITKIRDIFLDHLSNDDVIIMNDLYSIESVILHHGSSIYHGHYTSILRGINSWIRVDDSELYHSALFRSPTGNPYVVFLKKVNLPRQASTTIIASVSKDTEANKSCYSSNIQRNDSHRVRRVEVQAPTPAGEKVQFPECIDLTSEQGCCTIKSRLCETQKIVQIPSKSRNPPQNPKLGPENLIRNPTVGKNKIKNDGFIHISPIRRGTTLKSSNVHSSAQNSTLGKNLITPAIHQLGTESVNCSTAPKIQTSKIRRQYPLQNFLSPHGIPSVRNKGQLETNMNSSNVMGDRQAYVTGPLTESANAHAKFTKRRRDDVLDNVPGDHDNANVRDSWMNKKPCHIRKTLISGPKISSRSIQSTPSFSPTLRAPMNDTVQPGKQKKCTPQISASVNETTDVAERDTLGSRPILREPLNSNDTDIVTPSVPLVGPLVDVATKKMTEVSRGHGKFIDDDTAFSQKLKESTIPPNSASMGGRLVDGANHVPIGMVMDHLHDAIENDRIKRKQRNNRALYLRRRDEILQKKKDYYHLNKMNICAKRRDFYALNRDLYKLRYKKNKEKIRVRRRIRSRKAKFVNNNRSSKIRAAKKISRKYKNLRRRIAKYQKNFHKPIGKMDKKPKKTYRIEFRKKTDTLLADKERIVDRVMETSDVHVVLDRVHVDRIVTRCIHIRDSHVKSLKKDLGSIQNKCELAISKLGDVPLSENRKFGISILCGKSGHHSSTEPYFLKTAYNTDRFKRWLETDLDQNASQLSETKDNCSLEREEKQETMSLLRDNEQREGQLSEPLHESVDDVFIINDKGQVTNVLPTIPTRRKSDGFWVCDDYCREIDVDTVQEIKDLYYDVMVLSYKNLDTFISNVDVCSVQTRADNRKGHPITCYVEPLTCKSKFLKLDLLSYHFPNLRTMKRSIHRIKNSYQRLIDVGDALEKGDFGRLNQIFEDGKNIFVRSEAKQKEICLDEDELHDMYAKGIQVFKEIDMDPPRIPCISCERLCTSKYSSPVTKHLNPTISECLLLGDGAQNTAELSYWKQLQSMYDPEEFNSSFICNHCSNHLKKNHLPSLCILNNLRTDEVPEEIRTLNRFEKMLIQRAKAFQCVVKLETVQKKNIPHHMKLDQVKGRTFHLPLPLGATLNKLCKDTDPIDLNHELFVLIRSNPTKKKVIWEDYVDIKKIWTALKWLKVNNHLYRNIHLPGTPDELLTHLAKVDLEYLEDSGDEPPYKKLGSDDVTQCNAKNVNDGRQSPNSSPAHVGPVAKSMDARKTPDNRFDHPKPANGPQSHATNPQAFRTGNVIPILPAHESNICITSECPDYGHEMFTPGSTSGVSELK